MSRLVWQHPEELAGTFLRPALVAQSDGPCVVCFNIDDEGDYNLTWSVTVKGSLRSAAEAQRFAGRVADIINALPVVEPVE